MTTIATRTEQSPAVIERLTIDGPIVVRGGKNSPDFDLLGEIVPERRLQSRAQVVLLRSAAAVFFLLAAVMAYIAATGGPR
jgi:hypothetical protein